ncbi:unnamed protein product [Rotaria magnacalcarata]|nr:unnamed protein product [Rotaria magnacalcarata]
MFSINNECQINNSNHEIEYDYVENMEVDDTLLTPLPIVDIPKKSYKRKNQSNDDSLNKIFKSTTISTTTVKTNNTMIEKQIIFLQNLNDIIEKSIVEKSSITLTLDEQLSDINLKIIKIQGDGNCFFRAISHQLCRNESNHKTIRSTTINYLIENKDKFAPFIDDTDSTIDNYIELSAAAVIVNKNILIHELGKKPLFIPGSDYIDDQVHICYYPDKLHYNSVVDAIGNTAILPSEAIVFT